MSSTNLKKKKKAQIVPQLLVSTPCESNEWTNTQSDVE